MPWSLVYAGRATRDLDGLPTRDRRAMHDRLSQLVPDPGTINPAKLGGDRRRAIL